MFDKVKDKNHCGTVTRINKINILEGCDNIVAAIVFGNSVIVGKNTQIGELGVYFPPETQLSQEFLHKNNLYRKAELNDNINKKGYFEENGRIRIATFKNNKSEGIFLPINCLDYVLGDKYTHWDDITEGSEFDTLNGHEICKKYIPKNTKGEPTPKKARSDKKAVNKFDRLIDNQFRLHIDTIQARKNIHLINPEDLISISNKLHGSSFIVGKVLTKKTDWINYLGFKLADIKLPNYRAFKYLDISLRNLSNKLIEHDSKQTIYDTIYSSRKCIKNKYINVGVNAGFYNYDLWGDIAKKLKSSLLDGITLYGEAVGQLPTGSWIQNGYHYGTKPYQYDIYVYRITFTNPSGKVIELSWPQIKEYCNKFGIKYVPEFYYGRAKDFYPEIPTNDHWHENFLGALESEFMLDRMCPMNNNEVPEEGIVIKKDELFDCNPMKLKNWLFMKREAKEIDSGKLDMETEQGIEMEEQ